MTDTQKALLRLEGLTKTYGAVVALRDATLDVHAGEVMCLIGENGAGKSTLVKILAGIVTPDSGRIAIDGEVVQDLDRGRWSGSSVAVVQQELSLIPAMSVAENTLLGSPAVGTFRSGRTLRRLAQPHLAAVGLSYLDSNVEVSTLTIAEQQLVEVARVLAKNARVVIFDEPTATLSDNEIARVHAVVRRVAEAGKAVIYVTHRLREVFQIGHSIYVLRNGVVVARRAVEGTTVHDVIGDMLGRTLADMYPDRRSDDMSTVSAVRIESLEVDGLAEPFTLDLRAGEIVGLAGQIGSGAPQVLRTIATQRRKSHITLSAGEGDEPGRHQPSVLRSADVAYCSDDRKRDGTFQTQSVRRNLSSPSLRKVSHRWGMLSTPRELRFTDRLAGLVGIRSTHVGLPVSALSGGNQQKVAVGKWLGTAPRILLVEEPTRGVDVGARVEIYKILREQARQGVCIMFASSDLEEVLGFADTIVTFFRGNEVSRRPANEFTAAQLVFEVTHGDPWDAASPTHAAS